MPEIRKHYFLDEYVIIATERAKRPTDFSRPGPPAPGPAACPFCPGREERTPPASAAYVRRGDGVGVRADGAERVRGWSVRVFPNLFPAVGPDQGAHEVIAETPDHDRHPSRLKDDEAALLFRALRDRFLHHSGRGARYVSLFRNHRPEAGASLAHPHSQLISLPLVPPMMAVELDALARSSPGPQAKPRSRSRGEGWTGTEGGGANALSRSHLPTAFGGKREAPLQGSSEGGRKSTPLCALCRVAREEGDGERAVLRRGSWAAFAPRCSRKPFEAWVVPEAHLPSLREVEGALLRDLALATRDLLARMEGVLGDFPYNAMLFQMGEEAYHLSLRIQPELAIAAGFEKNTGIYINPLPPEEAARALREAKSPEK